MIRFHREGRATIFITLIFLFAVNFLMQQFVPIQWLQTAILIVSLILLIIVLQFFRDPERPKNMQFGMVIAPADGKVVLVEEVDDAEYFKGKRLQISIFMSPFNVHVNRYPVTGTVTYAKLHQGQFLVAWHPKASTLNERTTVVQKTEGGNEIMYRQIAGALARRIVMYAKPNTKVVQTAESGFIKFGSRVDILMPLGTEVLVKPGDITKGGVTAIAKLS